ncbi:hypothetical protein [Acetobacter sp.]|uniref:hypothetical protein n=1 Tax=Acetobacter sp. TaxID=440 RepID=UPI0039E83F7D
MKNGTTLPGQSSNEDPADAPPFPEELVQDLLSVVTVLKRRQRDQAAIVKFGPAVIEDAKECLRNSDLEVARTMAVIRQFVPDAQEPAPYEGDLSPLQEMKERFISSALYKAERARRQTRILESDGK